jgi:hypothetical protein
MDPRDNGQYNICAYRELREEAAIPRPWMEPLSLELASFPEGHTLINLTAPNGSAHRVAVWLVHIPHDVAFWSIRPTKQGQTEMIPDTLKWRPALEVAANLEKFRSFATHGEAIRLLLDQDATA